MFAGHTHGQDRGEQAQARLKAIYVYNFATLVDWPSEYKRGSFIIGVYGDTKVYDELQKNHSSKTVGSQPIRVKKFNKFSEIERCHILYVSADKSASVAKLADKFMPKSTLVVTESQGLLKDGSIINFIVQGNKAAYEVSKTNAEKHRLIINSTLTNLAAHVE